MAAIAKQTIIANTVQATV